MRAWPASVAAILLAVLPAAADAPQRLIWITLDSLRADHLHYMGYARETSPWLDSFAEESVDFRLAIAPSNATRRSVAAYMAGKYSRDLLDKDPPRHIPTNETTLAELLRGNGFRTWAWVANPKLARGVGFEQGFDQYYMVQPAGAPKASIAEIIAHIRNVYRPSGGREFIYIHTMDVHLPYRPPSPYGRLYAAPYDRSVVREGAPFDSQNSYVLSNLPYFSQSHDLGAEDVEFLVSQYDGAIRYTDANLAALLDALEVDAQQDLVVITSDHGEQFFEHGYWSHGKLMLTEEIHVPLLIRFHDFHPGSRTQAVSLLDLYPTLAELVGAPVPPGLAGTSLLAAFRDGEPPQRPIISEHQHRLIAAAAVVGDGYLYQLNADVHNRYPWRIWPFAEELYDLRTDPGCRRNLVADSLGLADRFNAALREQRPQFKAYTPELIRGSDGDVRFGPDLFETSSAGTPCWALALEDVETCPTGHVRLRGPTGQAHLRATVTDPGHAHLLEVTYQLGSGALVLGLQTHGENAPEPVNLEFLPAHPTVAWHYRCEKRTDGPQTVRAVVYPRNAETYLVAAMVLPGEATVESVRLRRAFIPESPSPYRLPPPEARSADPELSPGESARLRALGYMAE